LEGWPFQRGLEFSTWEWGGLCRAKRFGGFHLVGTKGVKSQVFGSRVGKKGGETLGGGSITTNFGAEREKQIEFIRGGGRTNHLCDTHKKILLWKDARRED